MKKILILAGIILANAMSSLAFGQSASPELTTVERVELPRYIGKWHEIALLPNRFQAQCIADTTATYAMKDNGNIEVTNRCKLADGKYETALGEAKLAKPDNTTKLKVRFAPWYLSWLPQVWGNYWVIKLEPNYQYAVVSEPDRKMLWILSRTPTMNAETLTSIKTELTAKGFDMTKLQLTPQSGG
jgi:apolipoprotein D and lipocalin family protein